MKAFRWWETDNHPSFPLKFQLTPVGSHLSLLSHFLSIFHSQLPALLTSSQHQVKEHRLYINLSILRKRRKWQPTPIFLHGEFHGQGSLAGYSLWGHKESNTTEQLTQRHTYSAHHRGSAEQTRGSEDQRVSGGVQAHFSQRLWGTGPGTSSDPRSLQILEAALRECLRVGDGERKVGAWIQGSHHPLIGTTCQTYCPIGPGCWLGRWLLSHRPSSLLLVPTHGFFWHVWEQLLGREKTFRNTLVFKSQFFTELLNAIYKSYSMNRSSQF